MAAQRYGSCEAFSCWLHDK